MTLTTRLIDRLEPFHADAFSWAVACLGGDLEVAADALQEAYVKVLSGTAVFGGMSTLKTWWFGVVRLTALEQQRKTRRWDRTAEYFLDWLSTLGANAVEYRSNEFESEINVAWLTTALKKLPPRQSEVLHLVFQQQCSLSEAAIIMKISVGSARQHYDRAKKKLSKLRPTTEETLICTDVICNHAN